ncbi:MAG: outer membrane protein assembly factor BamA [Rickettsiales bacterium]|nr:outer membrane protein assembly factor BamA [Rickettsiales bacterium]
MKTFFLRYIAVLVVLGLCSSKVYAENAVINDIQVTGNQRIEASTIISYLSITKGEPYDSKKIDKSLKQLFQTGLFEDISITHDEGVIDVHVIESPILNELVFKGNKRINTEDLQKELRLNERSVLTQAKIQRDVNRLLRLYQKSGRFSVNIETEIEKLEQNRVNLVFDIDEGKKADIKKIYFVNNEIFSSSKLKRVIQSKESAWYRFFSGYDTYDEDRLAFDEELLRRYYITRGYADFKVVSSNAEMTSDKNGFIVTFTLDEGIKYDFGDIEVTSTIERVDTEALSKDVNTRQGEVFNASLIEESVDTITKSLTDLGYAFVAVEPILKRDPEKQTIVINYKIQEGPKVYIERIDIVGNTRTLDKVIRREFRINESDPYNAAQLRRSRQRINNLGFFDKVELNTEKGSAPDKAVINVEVSERPTGELNFGAGFSTTDGALVNASIRERNLLGKGQDLRFGIQRATKGLEVDISFTEPYFMDKDLSVGLDVFRISRDRESESSFDSDSLGSTVRATYSIVEALRHTIRYSYRTDDITNIEPDASRFIKDQEGENTTSLIGHSLFYDKRDTNRMPSAGYMVRFNQDLAGLGGDSQFLRNELRGEYFKKVWKDDVVLKLAAKSGYIMGLNDEDVRINERFFIGGNDIRGFRNAGVGPRDSLTLDALGGNLYYSTSAELRFPLGLPEELGFLGAAFVDAGSLSEVDDSGSEVLDKNSVRVAAGLGLSWSSPLGPIRIDFANPFVKESFDKTQEVRFSFGTRF